MPKPQQISPEQLLLQELLNEILKKKKDTKKVWKKLLPFVKSSGRNYFLYLDIIIEYLNSQEVDTSTAFLNQIEKEKLLNTTFMNNCIARISHFTGEVDVTRTLESNASKLKLFLIQKWFVNDEASKEVSRQTLEQFVEEIALMSLWDYIISKFVTKENEIPNLRKESVEFFLNLAKKYAGLSVHRGREEYLRFMPPGIIGPCILHFHVIRNQYPIEEGDIVEEIILPDNRIEKVSLKQIGYLLSFTFMRLLGTAIVEYKNKINSTKAYKTYIQNYFKEAEPELAEDLTILVNNPYFILKPVEIVLNKIRNFQIAHPKETALDKPIEILNQIKFNEIIHKETINHFVNSFNKKALVDEQENLETAHNTGQTEELLYLAKKQNLCLLETFYDNLQALLNKYQSKINDQDNNNDKHYLPSPQFALEAKTIIRQYYNQVIINKLKEFFTQLFIMKIIDELPNLFKMDPEFFEKAIDSLIKAVSKKDYALIEKMPINHDFKDAIKQLIVTYNLFDSNLLGSGVLVKRFIKKIGEAFSPNFTYRHMIDNKLRKSPLPLSAISNELIVSFLNLPTDALGDIVKQMTNAPLLNDPKFKKFFNITSPFIAQIETTLTEEMSSLLIFSFTIIEINLTDPKNQINQSTVTQLIDFIRTDKEKILGIIKILIKAFQGVDKQTISSSIDLILNSDLQNMFLALILKPEIYNNFSKLLILILYKLYKKQLTKEDFSIILNRFHDLMNSILSTPGNRTASFLANNLTPFDTSEYLADDAKPDEVLKYNLKTLYKTYKIETPDGKKTYPEGLVGFAKALIGGAKFFTEEQQQIYSLNSNENVDNLPKDLSEKIIKFLLTKPEALRYSTALTLAIDANDEYNVKRILELAKYNNMDFLTTKDCSNNLPLDFAIKARKHSIIITLIEYCISIKNVDPVKGSAVSLYKLNHSQIKTLLKNELFKDIKFIETTPLSSPRSSFAQIPGLSNNNNNFFQTQNSTRQKLDNLLNGIRNDFVRIQHYLKNHHEETETWFITQINSINEKFDHKYTFIRMVAEFKKYDSKAYMIKIKNNFLPWFETCKNEVFVGDHENSKQEMEDLFLEKNIVSENINESAQSELTTLTSTTNTTPTMER